MFDKIRILTDPALKSVFSFLLKKAYERINKIIEEYGDKTELLTTEKELYNNIIEELKKTYNWASLDIFSNHANNVSIYKRYVHLDLLLEPRRYHVKSDQLLNKKTLTQIISKERKNIIILGQPGGGKTTTIKYIINSILFDPYFLTDIYAIPILIKLRELNKSNSILAGNQRGGIFEKLSNIFGINMNIVSSDEDNDKDKIQIIKKILVSKLIPSILDNQKILLILDGFDEITDDRTKELIIAELKDLSQSLNNANFILTSRTVDFKVKLEGAEVFELCEMDDMQIKEFSDKWFEDEELSEKFVQELFAKTPYKDFYRRPLLLTHIASIYSKTQELPNKPKLIYETIIDLALKEWNEIQGVKRKSKYAAFSVNRKREFLCTVAYYLTIKYGKKVFSRAELADIYSKINSKFKELPTYEVEDVIDEIESHNGIILRTGFDKFEFSHLTIQEFFVANYIVKAGSIRLSVLDMLKIPNELAIAVALSSDPSMLLYDILVDKIFKDEVHVTFLDKFFARINLEKPDFEIGPIFNICLLCIYTKIANKDNDVNNDGAFLAEKRLKLEDFMESNLSKDFLNEISDYYVLDNLSLKTKNKFEYIGFRKLRNAPNEFHSFNFPKYLLWNKTKYKN